MLRSSSVRIGLLQNKETEVITSDEFTTPAAPTAGWAWLALSAA